MQHLLSIIVMPVVLLPATPVQQRKDKQSNGCQQVKWGWGRITVSSILGISEIFTVTRTNCYTYIHIYTYKWQSDIWVYLFGTGSSLFLLPSAGLFVNWMGFACPSSPPWKPESVKPSAAIAPTFRVSRTSATYREESYCWYGPQRLQTLISAVTPLEKRSNSCFTLKRQKLITILGREEK